MSTKVTNRIQWLAVCLMCSNIILFLPLFALLEMKLWVPFVFFALLTGGSAVMALFIFFEAEDAWARQARAEMLKGRIHPSPLEQVEQEMCDKAI